MAKRWLFKEEPKKYSFEDLLRDRSSVWDGVRNNLALKYLRNVRRGDQILFYQTGKDRAVAGIMRAASDPYPDPAADDERLVVVDVEVQQGLQRPVTLAELRQERAFEKSELLRIPRLSVMPISASQWQVVLRRAQGAAD